MSDYQRPKRIRPGSLNTLKGRVWGAVLAAEDLLEHPEPEIRLRAVHALGQSANVYRSILADHDLEQRLAQLEQRAEQRAEGRR